MLWIPSACFLRSASFQMFLEGLQDKRGPPRSPPPRPVQAVGVRRPAPGLGGRCQPEPRLPVAGGEAGIRQSRAPRGDIRVALSSVSCGNTGERAPHRARPTSTASRGPLALSSGGREEQSCEGRRRGPGPSPASPPLPPARGPPSRHPGGGSLHAVGIFRSCGGRRV